MRTHTIFNNLRSPNLVALLILASLVSFIVISKVGVTPDTSFWNVAGVPLTTLQLILALCVSIVLSRVANQILATFKISPQLIDIAIALVIYVAGISIWSQTPMIKHFNARRPAPPAYQYFPFGDARVHDVGAISINEGYGIYFGRYTDKPLYMIFISFLHRIAGNDYNRIGLLHIYAVGLLLPGLYWFGRQLHSRLFGIAIALVVLIRQRSAILFAHVLAGTNPRLLLTEIPTMLGIIVLCIIIFSWINARATDNKSLTWAHPFLAGGILGALSLIRLNPIALLPIIVLVSVLALRKSGVNLLRPIIVFILGFLLVFTSWAVTGRDSSGQSYFLVKILDVIKVRYYPDLPALDNNLDTHLPVIRKSASASSPQRQRSNPQVDTKDFPGFVINHTLHNAVAAFLALPDSFFLKDQAVQNLLKRPYLDENQLLAWRGDLKVTQIPFLALNLFLLAMGLGWSWNRWKWAGLFPAIVFIAYSLTLGFARTSGSRYIVPIDWIVFLYYILGIFLIVERFTVGFRNIEKDTISLNQSGRAFPPSIVIAMVTCMALLVPIVQLPILSQNFPVCEGVVSNSAFSKLILIKGQVLYPYLVNGDLSFSLMVCNGVKDITIDDFQSSILPGATTPGKSFLEQGQDVILGFSRTNPDQLDMILFAMDDSTLMPIWAR